MKVMPFVVFLLLASFAVAREKPPYEMGTFLSSRQVSDGTYSTASCGRFGCNGSAYNAAHNVHLVSTPDGIFSIEAPISVAGSLLLGIARNGNAPIVHKAWFMDDLHEGDKVLFSSQCGKHGRCSIRLPDPDNPKKEIATLGFFFPAIAKTNTTVLCGTGKLTPSVEAQVCSQEEAPLTSAAPNSASLSHQPVSAANPARRPESFGNATVTAKPRTTEISALSDSHPTVSPETQKGHQTDSRQKKRLDDVKKASAQPEASMVSRYWGIPENPITSAPWFGPEKPFTPVGPIKQYWDGKKFDEQFFNGIYGKAHQIALNGSDVVWRGTPFKMHSSFCQGGFCFTLFDSIPTYWFYNGVAPTYIDETCVDHVDFGDFTCAYFLYDADDLAQRVMIFVAPE
jgi:hypothetical protein